ncbi:MAG TPA: VWA domain-containing protein [Terriglobales bacterium]|nr:VWA domain-containing protein [Terriglobales bacterium]
MSRRKARLVVLWGLAWWLTASALAQVPADNTPQPTVRVTTGLVLVDAVVTDRNGRPVRDLKAEDFAVYENGKPVKLAFATLHTPEEARSAVPPALPPNVYTNRPEYRSTAEPLVILLLDARNTRMQDQAYARLQLLKYLGTQLRPDQPVAVYALGSSLTLLQDFTDDPAQLRAAVETFRPQASRELSMEDLDRVRAPEPREQRFLRFYRQMNEFYMNQVIAARDVRVAGTLAALRAIGRSMAGIPGRKNLVWVSAGFPLQSIETRGSYVSETRVTTAMLTDARVAVYPVDARGLVVGITAINADRPRVQFKEDIERASRQILDTQQSMEVMASFTGGRMFKNRNDIDNAVATSIREGSTYYVVGYYAENKNWDGRFRELRVRLKRPGLTIRHRQGYFAFDPEKWETRSKAVQADMAWTLEATAMPATQIVFDARIAPAGSGEPVTLPIEFRVDLNTLSARPLANGGKAYRAEFHAVAINQKGDVAARLALELTAPVLSSDLHALEQQGLPFRLEMELPSGRYELRLGVRDVTTGFFGTLSAPVDVAAPTQ